MKYGELSHHYPDPVASGIYHTYIESSPATQMIIIGRAYDLKRREISDALNITPVGVRNRFKQFKTEVLQRLYEKDHISERDNNES